MVDNLCLASAVSRYEQVLADTLNQMAPIKFRVIIIHTNAPWFNHLIGTEKGLQESLNASGAGLNLNAMDWSIYNNVV